MQRTSPFNALGVPKGWSIFFSPIPRITRIITTQIDESPDRSNDIQIMFFYYLHLKSSLETMACICFRIKSSKHDLYNVWFIKSNIYKQNIHCHLSSPMLIGLIFCTSLLAVDYKFNWQSALCTSGIFSLKISPVDIFYLTRNSSISEVCVCLYIVMNLLLCVIPLNENGLTGYVSLFFFFF